MLGRGWAGVIVLYFSQSTQIFVPIKKPSSLKPWIDNPSKQMRPIDCECLGINVYGVIVHTNACAKFH